VSVGLKFAISFSTLLVVQAEQDQMINTDSANVIYNESESDEKDIKWYANSGHVITIDKEKELVNHLILFCLDN
jgi:esterase/lipase